MSKPWQEKQLLRDRDGHILPCQYWDEDNEKYIPAEEIGFGESGDSPDPNTLLGRIKNIEDKIADIISGDTPAAVQLTGSSLEIYGANISERPNASEVAIGTFFILVNTDELWQSNGTDWVVK